VARGRRAGRPRRGACADADAADRAHGRGRAGVAARAVRHTPRGRGLAG
jgi:hypothetical protein